MLANPLFWLGLAAVLLSLTLSAVMYSRRFGAQTLRRYAVPFSFGVLVVIGAYVLAWATRK